MEMNLTIYAYGYGKSIFDTLQAIAMLRNSTFYPAIINTIAVAVGVYYTWLMAVANIDGQWKQYIKKILIIAILINGLMLPKTSMNVKDHVEKYFDTVDNIPLAFALPIGLIEEFGHIITIGFEQAFTKINSRTSFNYYNYGTVFGARLAKEVMDAKIRDPEVTANMHNFIKRCIIVPAMIGQQFTKEELVSTNNIWDLVSKNAGTITRVSITENGKRSLPTCKKAVSYFESKFKVSERQTNRNNTQIMNNTEGFISKLSRKIKAVGEGTLYNSDLNKLNSSVKNQINALYSNNSSVNDIIRHNMMINALNDYHTANYPAIKAKMQHEAGGLISGALADQVLTGFLAVMKNMCYAAFIFLVPLMILTGGFSKYRNWISMCFSLQLWPSLFAILNMLIDYAYDPAQVVSYSAWATERQKFDSMVSVAANLTMLIPFLALWVTRMAEGGFLHLAGSVMQTASSAVAGAAAEQASGSRAWDNENIGNSTKNMTSANKFDTSQQFVRGSNSITKGDGTIERTNPKGGIISIAGAGYTSSSGESNYIEKDAMETSLNTMRSEKLQQVESTSASLSKAQDEQISQEASATYRINEAMKNDKNFSFDKSTEEGRILSKGFQEINRLSEGKEEKWDKAHRGWIKANAEFGTPLKKYIGIGVSIEAGGEVSVGQNSSSYNSDTDDISQEGNVSQSNNNTDRRSVNSSFLESAGIDKDTQESMRSSYNKTKRLEETLSTQQEELNSYDKTLSYVKSHGYEFSKDIYSDVVKAVQNNERISHSEAQKEVSKGSDSARFAASSLIDGRIQEVQAKIAKGRINIQDSTKATDFQTTHQKEINQNPNQNTQLDQFKEEKNIKNELEIKKELNESKLSQEKGFNEQRAKNDQMYNSKQEKSKELYEKRKNAKRKLLIEDSSLRRENESAFEYGASRLLQQLYPDEKPIKELPGFDKIRDKDSKN